MTVSQVIDKFVKWAESQVGYKAKSGKKNKYAEFIDKYPEFYNYPKNGFDWCDIFYDVGMCQCFGIETGRKMLYQPKKSTGAGCGFSAQFYRDNDAFTKVPQVGAQIFYGPSGNESHTGVVVKVEKKYIYTVEGNTGGGDGQVQRKKVAITANISGYGIPNWKLAATEDKRIKEWGIDISAWQGDYNLEKAKKEGVKFVVLKGGGGDDGLYKDSRYEANYKKAKDLGLKVGVYWFSKALSEADAKKEAKYFYDNCLKGKKFELPIYIDVENKTQLNLGKRKLTDIVKAWLKAVNSYGYWVGIYSSASYFKTYMYDSELTGYAHWIAQWSKNEPSYTPKTSFGLWQFGGETNLIRSNKVAGQVTDQNYLLIDYTSKIKAKGLNGWGSTPTPTPTPTPIKKGLTVNGKVDEPTTKALQKWLGTYQDGEISGQLTAQKEFIPAVTSAEFSGGGSACIKALQNALIKAGYSVGRFGADGYLGKDTVEALQRYLNAKQGSKLTVDGVLGTNTAKILQTYLNKVVYGV